MRLDAVPVSRSQKPLVAGVLLVGAAILDIVTAIALLTWDVWSVAARVGVPSYIVPSIEGFLRTCGALVLVFGIIAGIGGVFSYRRRMSTLAIIGAIFGMLGVGPFYLGAIMGLVALILIAISRDDFDD